MVRGHPQGYNEAQLILDDVVRMIFLFLRNNPDQVQALPPPPGHYANQRYSELSDWLRRMELISEGYSAVVSGYPRPIPLDETRMGVSDYYTLGIYHIQQTTHSKEPSGVNAHLNVKISGVNAHLNVKITEGSLGLLPSLVLSYRVKDSIFFEEANGIFEGSSFEGNRTIRLTPNRYMWGEEGKQLFRDGSLIVENLQEHHRKEVQGNPPGTVYLPGDLSNRVDVYTLYR